MPTSHSVHLGSDIVHRTAMDWRPRTTPLTPTWQNDAVTHLDQKCVLQDFLLVNAHTKTHIQHNHYFIFCAQTNLPTKQPPSFSYDIQLEATILNHIAMAWPSDPKGNKLNGLIHLLCGD